MYITQEQINEIVEKINKFNKNTVKEGVASLSPLNLDNFNNAEIKATLRNKQLGEEHDNQGVHPDRDGGKPRGEQSKVDESVSGEQEATELPGQPFGFNFESVQPVDSVGLSGERGDGDTERSGVSTLSSDSDEGAEQNKDNIDLGFDFENINELSSDISDPIQEKGSKTNQNARVNSDLQPKEENKEESYVVPVSGAEQSEQRQVSSHESLGQKGKFKANLKAINTIKSKPLEQLTDEDRQNLGLYSGWGGLPNAFYKPDGSSAKNWDSEALELKALLTMEEYESLRSSTLDSHYTPEHVMNAIWGQVQEIGFTGGKILEPSAGVGGFLKTMPDSIKQSSQVDAIELEGISAKILSGIYSNNKNIKVHHKGFESHNPKNGTYDLVIGNPPFGNFSVHDSNRKHLNNLSIHNYFFAKSLELLKEDGVMAMVVSSYLMDSKTDKTRRMLGEKANLIGAVRLPDTTFKKSANTEVTTDILFFQKVKEGQETNIDSWMELGEVNGFPINSYFEKNKDNLLGDFIMSTGAYRESTTLSDSGIDIETALPDAMISFKAESSVSVSDIEEGSGSDASEGDPIVSEYIDENNIKIGQHFLVNDEIYLLEHGEEDQAYRKVTQKMNSKNEYVDLSPRDAERMKGMIVLSELADKLRAIQVTDSPDDEIEVIRENLNSEYDAFIKKNGFLNAQTNKGLFRHDLNSPLLLSLEKNYDKGVSSAQAKKQGIKSRKASCEKSDIFKKRTQYPRVVPTQAGSVKEGLLISLSEKTIVDINYISELVGRDSEAVKAELKSEGLVFFNDFDGVFETKEQYLSGNVKKKLKQTNLPENKMALEEVLPPYLEANDISAQFGASWIPEEYFLEFIEKVTGSKNDIVFHRLDSKWEISGSYSNEKGLDHGTSRRTPVEILESLMNNKTIQVFDKIDDKLILNNDQTMLAIRKAEEIERLWKDWVYDDSARRERIVQIYNDTFNVNALTEYDGSHLELPGKVDDAIFNPRPHQKNVAWRIIQGKPTLLDHTVGTGKTASSVFAIMELRRTKRANKPMVCVPNHLVSQWSKEFLDLYPNANILAPSKVDFEKANRKILMNRIMTGDYDAVILGHSQLMKIENEPEVEMRMIKEEISNLASVISDSGKNFTVKRAQKRVRALEAKLSALSEYDRDELGVTFSEMGIDALFVDEAHEFKNLSYQTSMSRVGGLGNPDGSKKAFDLYVKTEALLEKTNGNNLVFLTGTPISNTIAEMYTMQRYLSRHDLYEKGIENFDSWVKAFAEVVTDWELTATMKYKLKSRLAKFNNMPELVKMYRTFADVITREFVQEQMKKEGLSLPIPKISGGKPDNVVAERSDIQAEFIGEELEDGSYTRGSLIHRAESGEDIMLKIISDARKCALDMRIVDSSNPDYEGSKVNRAIEKSIELYKEYDEDKGTQLIFCDLSTPKGSVSREKEKIQALISAADLGCEESDKELSKYSHDDLAALMGNFSVYDDIKEKLINSGIPEGEVAFIHDANTDEQKQTLYSKVNSGDVRFLLGSTSKMGAGMNVQKRLVGLHHLDAPWRPSDLEQREGRIIRQGNELVEKYRDFEVYIGRYATKNTLDSMMWQIIESKARFIEQVRSGSVNERQVEDLEGQSASAAEMKAASSGNPLILEEMKVRQEIKKLETVESSVRTQNWQVRKSLESKVDYIRKFKERESLISSDIERVNSISKENYIKFEMGKLKEEALKSISKEEREKLEKSGEEIVIPKEKVDEVLKDSEKEKSIMTRDFYVEHDGKVYSRENRVDYGDAIKDKLITMDNETELSFGFYNGFEVILEKEHSYYMNVILKGESGHEYNTGRPILEIRKADPIGITSKIINTVNRISSDLEESRYWAIKSEKEIPVLESRLDKKFEDKQELESLRDYHGKIIEALSNGEKEVDINKESGPSH